MKRSTDGQGFNEKYNDPEFCQDADHAAWNPDLTAKGSGNGRFSCCLKYFDANDKEIEVKNNRPIALKNDAQECSFDVFVPFTCPKDTVPASAQVGFYFWKDLDATLSDVKISFEPASGNPALQAVKRTDWAESRSNAMTKKAKQSQCRIMFLGDSLTHMWEYPADHKNYPSGLTSWNDAFKPLGAENYGISGDRIEHIFWRITEGEQLACQPALVVLLIGTNNRLAQRLPSDMICDGIENLVKTIRVKSPNSKVLLIAILPRKGVPRDPATDLLKAMAEKQVAVSRSDRCAARSRWWRGHNSNLSRCIIFLPKGYEVYAEVLLQSQRMLDIQ